MLTSEQTYIETIKRYPIIYNTKAKNYHDLNKKDAIWAKIVAELKDPEITDIKTAKSEWKKLRDSHRESLKRIREKEADRDSPTPIVNTWKHANEMAFLLPFIKNRRGGRYPNTAESFQEFVYTPTISDDQNGEFPEDVHYAEIRLEDMDASNATGTSGSQMNKRTASDSCDLIAAKRLRCEDGNASDDETQGGQNQHPLNMFFDSMCQTTKKFPTWIQRDVKKKLLNIINEAEEIHENYLE